MVFAFEMELTAGATGQQGMLIPPRPLIVLWLRAQNLEGPQPRVEQSTTYKV